MVIMDSDFGFDDLERELESLRQTHAQEQLNVQMEMQELNGIHEVVKVLQNENSHLQRLLNDTLYQVMLYSESDTAAQVLKCLSEIDTELAKLDMIRDGQRKATESLNEEFKETLDVLKMVPNVDQHKDVEKKIEELEKLACEREADVKRLKDEKEGIQKEMARVRKENCQEMDALMKEYIKLHTEMMEQKYGPVEHSDDSSDE